MSFLNQNPNALPLTSPGPAPVLERVRSSPVQGHAPFSQTFVPQQGGPSDPPAFNFQVKRSLRMHRKLAVMVGLAVCLLLLALGFKQPRTYTASSVIYVEPMVARNLNEQGVPGFDQFRYGSFLDQQMQTIVRTDVLTAALRTLPSGTWRGPLETEQSAVARLAKALTVERVLTSYQIMVQLKASDPQAAAAIVNAVTKAYLQRGREDEFKQADLREQILSEERDRVKQELERDRKEQAALGASMGLASPAEGALNPYDADLAGLRSQLASARESRDVAAAQLDSVSGQDPDHRSGLNASAEELVNTDPGLSAKKAAVNARRVVLESMMAGITPNNPQYRQAQDEIADLDRALDTKTAEVRAQAERRIQDKLRTDLQRTADVESKINAQLAQATGKATGAGPKLQRAAELANDIQRLTARYTNVDDALNALEVETSGPGMAHVPLPATVPLVPDSNHRDLFLMAALPVALISGIAAAVIARKSDGRIFLGSDLQDVIGFAPIAVLPAREDVSSQVVEEYVLRLAAGVESAYRTSGAQSFLVTAASAETDTGRLLSELASKLEDLRLRVLVIRASELLVTSDETMEHQAATAAMLPSANAPRTIQAGEGIATAKLDRLRGQYDLILVDAAPVLHSAETEYAARCTDATILVAESARTQIPELSAATTLLSRLRVTGVGMVLDSVKLEHADEQFRSAVRVIEQRSLESGDSRKPTASLKPEAFAVTARKLPADEAAAAKVDEVATDRRASAPVEDLPPAAVLAPSDEEKLVLAHSQPMVSAAAALVDQAEVDALAEIDAEPFPASTTSPSDLAVELVGCHSARTPEASEITGDALTKWTVVPEISPAEADPVIRGRAFRNRLDLLEDLADGVAAVRTPVSLSATGTDGASLHFASGLPGSVGLPTPSEARHAALQASSAQMHIAPNVPTSPGESTIPETSPNTSPESTNSDDPHAVGRFVGQKDNLGAVPSYTRSKIRLAFKEQEVNSKTTWFSKLFRGDPPANFRMVQEEEEDGPQESSKLHWEQPPARLPEADAAGDSELAYLLDRIKTSGENKTPPRLQAVSIEPEPPASSVQPVPFVERRAAPRTIEIDEYREPAAAAAASAAVITEAPPVSEAPIPAPLTPPLAPAPVSFSAPGSSSAIAAPDKPLQTPPLYGCEEHPSGSRGHGRPLRPLTFQQLAGSMALHEEPGPTVETLTAPVPQVAPPRLTQRDPVVSPAFGLEAAAPGNSHEGQRASLESASPEEPKHPLVTLAGNSGVTRLRAKEPMASAYVPVDLRAEAQAAPAPSAADVDADSDVVAPQVLLDQAESPSIGAQAAKSPSFVASSPSARRGHLERKPILPNPLTDPAPVQRQYRLESVPAASERALTAASATPSPEKAPAPLATVAPGTSFPPDHATRLQMFGRRKSDHPGEAPEIPGLTRRWKLLSQFEPVIADPLPAHRKGYTRSTDVNPPRRNDEG